VTKGKRVITMIPAQFKEVVIKVIAYCNICFNPQLGPWFSRSSKTKNLIIKFPIKEMKHLKQ
jgi:hypothetical protein